MRTRILLSAVVSLLLTISVTAQQQYTITPDHGPVSGGTQVTVHGEFGNWSYGLIFGGVSVPATRVDGSTLVAVTPAHLPGTVRVAIFEYDRGISTNLQFRFEGSIGEEFTALLLPVFTPPVAGAFGSEFRTEFWATLGDGERVDIHGLLPPCYLPDPCYTPPDFATTLNPTYPDVFEAEFTGNPGAYVYVPKNQIRNLSINLRAYDTSRSAENFGTEIPVVPVDDFFHEYETITLAGIPSDSRFRSTLRIYSYGDTGANLIVRFERLGGEVVEEQNVHLPPNPDLFHPGYLALTCPVNAGPLRVRIIPVVPPISAPLPLPDRWAFVSVTNNETQMITTITPQPGSR